MGLMGLMGLIRPMGNARRAPPHRQQKKVLYLEYLTSCRHMLLDAIRFPKCGSVDPSETISAIIQLVWQQRRQFRVRPGNHIGED